MGLGHHAPEPRAVEPPERNRSQPDGDKSISRSKVWPCSLATQVPADASVDKTPRQTLRHELTSLCRSDAR
jgi:hypothetical protein